jgi:hypothetical protein
MSHFTTIQAGLTDKDALYKGLINLLAEHKLNIKVELHDAPVAIHNGYYGEEDELAEVIIRREELSQGRTRALVDIGFAKRGATYQAVIDHYDFKGTILSNAFKSVNSFLEAVQTAHTKALIERDYPSEEWKVESVTKDQTTTYTLTKKTVEICI